MTGGNIMEKYLYEEIAALINAAKNCEANGNGEWYHRHREALDYIADNHLPSGSGVDNGTKIDFDASTGDRIVLQSSYHRMNENGFYCEWIDFTVTITPSLFLRYRMSIKGRFGRHQDIKEYLEDDFGCCLDGRRKKGEWYPVN
jgi:hypothetical protein